MANMYNTPAQKHQPDESLTANLFVAWNLILTMRKRRPSVLFVGAVNTESYLSSVHSRPKEASGH
eukprot:scaffold181422_cov19-Prasinocladus_malaysianus.AAC.1